MSVPSDSTVLVGVWLTYFVRIEATHSAVEYFDHKWEVEKFRADGTSAINATTVIYDPYPRGWLIDTVTFQHLVEGGIDQGLPVIHRELEGLRDKIGESLIGATALEIRSSSKVPEKSQRPLIAAEVGPVILEMEEHAASLEKPQQYLSKGRATLVVSDLLSEVEKKDFIRVQTNRTLFGLEAELLIPEILGHKVSWLAQQALNPGIRSRLESEQGKIFDLLKEITDSLGKTKDTSAIMQRVVAKIIKLRKIETVLSTNLHELTIQYNHLQHYSRRGNLKEIFETYESVCDLRLQSVRGLLTQLRELKNNASQVHELVALSISERRDKQVRHSEAIFAAIGVGIAAIAIVDSDLVMAATKWLSGSTLSAEVMPGAIIIFGVRFVVAGLLSFLAWKTIGQRS